MNYIGPTIEAVRLGTGRTTEEMLASIREEYLVLDEATPADLQKATNEALTQGWELLGGLQAFAAHGYLHFCQSLTRTAEVQRAAFKHAHACAMAIAKDVPLAILEINLRGDSRFVLELEREMRHGVVSQLGELGQHNNQVFGLSLLHSHLKLLCQQVNQSAA